MHRFFTVLTVILFSTVLAFAQGPPSGSPGSGNGQGNGNGNGNGNGQGKDDHDDKLDRAHEVESIRFEHQLVVRIKAAGDPREKRADDERHDLVAGRVKADGLAGDLVVVSGEEPAAIGRLHEVVHDEDRERRAGEGREQPGVLADPGQPALFGQVLERTSASRDHRGPA